MKNALQFLGILVATLCGSMAVTALIEKEREAQSKRKADIDASRLTELIYISKMVCNVEQRKTHEYVSVPVRVGHSTDWVNVHIPSTSEVESNWLVSDTKEMYFVPRALKMALIPFKEGEQVEIVSIKRPKDAFRELESIHVAQKRLED